MKLVIHSIKIRTQPAHHESIYPSITIKSKRDDKASWSRCEMWSALSGLISSTRSSQSVSRASIAWEEEARDDRIEIEMEAELWDRD